jgi:hypothetical protein
MQAAQQVPCRPHQQPANAGSSGGLEAEQQLGYLLLVVSTALGRQSALHQHALLVLSCESPVCWQQRVCACIWVLFVLTVCTVRLLFVLAVSG